MEQLTGQSVGLSRRTFLGVLGLLSLTGCHTISNVQGNGLSKQSAAELLKSDLFFIAHRGSGDNWTEHTLRAYKQAVACAAAAVELSIHRTKDGHFVCHHDPSLERLCGQNVLIAELTLEELAEYQNDARQWLGPLTGYEPIPTLSQALQELAGKTILFIEDKTGKYAPDLISVLKASPAPENSIVWKMEATAASRQAGSDAGYQTWGYFAPQNFDQIQRLAPEFDAIGIHDSANDTVIARAVATHKPVIVWEVHTRSQMQALQTQGVAGMMCSNLPYVTTSPAQHANSRDSFASGQRAAGDLPDVLTWNSQPKFLYQDKALQLSGQRKSGYVLGSMASLDLGNWSMDAQLRWPVIGRQNQIAGLAFGTTDDRPYRAFEKSQTHGFHLQVESSGELSLWSSTRAGPHLLARARQLNFSPNRWISLQLQATDTKLSVFLEDQQLFSADLSTGIAAGYLNLLTLQPANQVVDFKEILLQQL